MNQEQKRDIFGEIRAKLKRFLTENIGMKILSIVLAAVVWFVIMNVEDPVVSQTFSGIPVKITNEEVVTSKGYQYSIESGEKIDVKVEGKRSLVDNLTEEDLIAVADFNTMSSMYLVSIEASCPSHPDSDLIVTSKTENMSIKLEESATQSFNLRIVHEGNVKEGYFAYDESSVSLIQVTGAASQVAKVREVAVFIDVDGKKDSFEVEAIPVAIDLEGNTIDPMKLGFSQDIVNVRVNVNPVKEIEVEVVPSGAPAEGYAVTEVNFAPASVTIAGAQADLNRIGKLTIGCDVTDMNESLEQTFDLDSVLSEKYGDSYVAIEEDASVAAVVKIVKLEEMYMEISMSDIDVRNLPEGLDAHLFGLSTTNVRVLADPAIKETIKPSDLGLYVDLKGASVGTHTFALNADPKVAAQLTGDGIAITLKNKE